jgi:diaminohydroxyphosphoribosylaminopyrimidine deaminase/5-amino-6-(5-phosphoribosylamino)uracil reductase
VLAEACAALNPGFNHWVVHGTPYVTLKAAMTLDGKIATARGESRWITGASARRHVMELRRRADAILVGVNTVLLDDPSLTVRLPAADERPRLRVVLDSLARTPPGCQLLTDAGRERTVIVVSRAAPAARRRRLAQRGQVWIAPRGSGGLDLRWVLRRLGAYGVTHVLVEGGGQVHAAFLHEHLAHAIAFYYAPKILGGADSRKAVAGAGAACRADLQRLTDVRWRRLGGDLLLTATIRHAADTR